MLTGVHFDMHEKKILFIDDEEAQRDVMGRVLDKMGYMVTISDSSERALEILKKETFPLIITDLSMPGMDGTMFCKAVRQTNTESVIYALSGYIEAYETDKLEQLGFDGYLRKPATVEMLKRAIDGAFDKINHGKDD